MLIGGLGDDQVFGEGGDDVFIFFEAVLWGGSDPSIDYYDGGAGSDTLLLFLSDAGTPSQSVSSGATIFTFGDGSTLTAESIENIELHFGLPEDPDSPINGLALEDDLWARYDEAQLWGVV